MRTAPAPLYRDPIFDGPTDPTIIWNRQEKSWWIIYTSRRANVPCHDVTWVHGTDLGVASSKDNGQTWLYRGTLNIEAIEPGRNTYWAPEVLWAYGQYHMFVSYITGVPTSWVGDRTILHYTSDNLWDWKYVGPVTLPSKRVIDACIHPLPSGGWRLWYKDEDDHSHTHYADSPDLYSWEHQGLATTDQAQEGPNVFPLGGKYWMIADIWDGQAVYSSDDLTTWTRQEGAIMSGAGKRREDANRAHHADVLVVDDHAYMFYFVHPGKDDPENLDGLGHPNPRRSSVQTAELKIVDGKLVSLRDEEFDFFLPEMEG